MADLTTSLVTVLDAWTTGATNGKRNVVKRVKWTNLTAGGDTNKILASGFGLTKILTCSNILDADNNVLRTAVPSEDASYVIVGKISDGTPEDLVISDGAFAYITVEGVR